jgi:alanine racemase
MDMLMIDVTDLPVSALDGPVTLIGRDGSQEITVDDLARWAGTVSYEILCGISKRVPRVLRDAAVTLSPGPTRTATGGT